MRKSQSWIRGFLATWDDSTVIQGASRLASGCKRFVPGTSESSQECSSYFQVHWRFSPVFRGVPELITITHRVLLYHWSAIAVTLKAGWNAILRFHTLQKLMHLSLHSTSSQTFLGVLQWLKYILLKMLHLLCQGWYVISSSTQPNLAWNCQ